MSDDPDLIYARRRDAVITAAAAYDVLARHCSAPRSGNYVSTDDITKLLSIARFLLETR